MLMEFFIGVLVILGLCASYQDIKNGKISNLWAVLCIASAVILHGLIYIYYGSIFELSSYMLKAILSAMIALSIGVGLWYFGWWTAGDAKIFFAFSLLAAPISAFRLNSFSLLDLLINIFVPLGIYLIFSSFEKTTIQEKIASVRKFLSPLSLLCIALLLFFISWPLGILVSYFPFYHLQIVATVFIALFGHKLENKFGTRLVWALALLGIVRILFDNSLLSVNGWKSTVIALLIVVVVRVIIAGLVRGAFTREVPLQDLKEGMVVAEGIYKKGEEFIKKPILFSSSVSKSGYSYAPNGLTDEMVKKLKRMPKKYGISSLKVYETISFAPFIFLGTLLQVVLGKNVLTYLFRIF